MDLDKNVIICPECFTSIMGGRTKCPYCGWEQMHEKDFDPGRKNAMPIKAILGFTAFALLFCSVLFAYDLYLGGAFVINIPGGSCGASEPCLLEAMARCQMTNARGLPYGIYTIKIMGKQEETCYVAVNATRYDYNTDKSITKEHICAFTKGTWDAVNLQDMRGCTQISNKKEVYESFR